MVLDDGKTERVILAHKSGFEAFQEAITEYRVLGPMINGCSWIELRPLTYRKHQVQNTLCKTLERLGLSRYLIWHCNYFEKKMTNGMSNTIGKNKGTQNSIYDGLTNSSE